MENRSIRETRGYKITYISVITLLSVLVIYLYTFKFNDLDYNFIYHYIFLVVIFFATVIRRVIMDIVALLYLLFLVLLYFL